jgi:hypothetical protein
MAAEAVSETAESGIAPGSPSACIMNPAVVKIPVSAVETKTIRVYRRKSPT